MHTPLTLPLPITYDTEAAVLSDTESEREEVPTEAPASEDASLDGAEPWRAAVDDARDATIDHIDTVMQGLMAFLEDLSDDLHGRMGTLEAGLAKALKLTESLRAAMPLSKIHLVRAPPEPACLVASVPPTPGPPT